MKIYFGLDGGASSTRAVILNSNGKTLNKKKLSKGTNLKVYQNLAPKRITDLILELCHEISTSVDDISAFGFGLAAVSHDDGRELLFKELDRINIADRSILVNDAEAAYKTCCQDDVGILLTVGTGVICIAKNSNGDFVRVAGKGHDKSDVGSGYWIGKEVLLKLSFNHFKCFKLKSCCSFIWFIGIERTIVFFPVNAQIVLVTEESIPPDIPTTKVSASSGIDWQ